MKKYDTIDFRIEKLKLDWKERNCCVILINEEELLPIIRQKEEGLFKKFHLDPKGAGNYNYLEADDLYVYLRYADLTCGDTKAPILCCSCDEVECDCVRVKISCPLDAVIWSDFESLNPRNGWKYGLGFRFEPEAYRDFMKRLKGTE